MHNGLVDPQLLFITDEACFNVTGYVNSHNTRIWSEENPHAVHHIPLHDIKIETWCAISARRIIGPIFYQENVSSSRYVGDILGPFFEELTDDEKTVWLLSTILLRILHGINWVHYKRCSIISTGLWPPRSPDLSVYDFNLWGNLKGRGHRNTPCTAEALLNEIRMWLLRFRLTKFSGFRRDTFEDARCV
jgi:hypothetical protein